MQSAYLKLIRRSKIVKNTDIKGFFKTLEVTYNAKSQTYHPHFHIITCVAPRYFKTETYIKREEWLKLWQKCMQDDSITQVDIRKVKATGKGFAGAVAEVAKYASKPSDYLKKVNNVEDTIAITKYDYRASTAVLKVLMEALKGVRLISYSGIFKDIKAELKLEDEEKSNLIKIGAEDTDFIALFTQIYRWDIGLKIYSNSEE